MLRKASTLLGMLATGLLVLAISPSARANGWKYKRCEPSTEVFHSPFFGYYPTCWRTWPPGQPACPPAILLPAQPLAEPGQSTEKLAPPTEMKGREKVKPPAPPSSKK